MEKLFKEFAGTAMKILLSRTFTMAVSSFCEYTFNINIGRKMGKININIDIET